LFDSSADWTQPIFVEIGKEVAILEAKRLFASCTSEVTVRAQYSAEAKLQPRQPLRLVIRLVSFVREGGGTAILARLSKLMPMTEFDKLFAVSLSASWARTMIRYSFL